MRMGKITNRIKNVSTRPATVLFQNPTYFKSLSMISTASYTNITPHQSQMSINKKARCYAGFLYLFNCYSSPLPFSFANPLTKAGCQPWKFQFAKNVKISWAFSFSPTASSARALK